LLYLEEIFDNTKQYFKQQGCVGVKNFVYQKRKMKRVTKKRYF